MIDWYFSKSYTYFKSKLIYIEISLIDFILSFGPFKFPKVKFKICKRDFFPFIYNPKGKLFDFRLIGIQWKDKYDTPRYEGPPYIGINLFNYSLIFYWEPYIHQWDDLDQYWEQALWYLYYTNTISQGLNDKPDIQKAKESWSWQDMQGNSTWSDKFLIK